MADQSPLPPRTRADLPEDVQQFLHAREEASERHTDGCERRSAARRFRGTILGTVVALVFAPVLGAQTWWAVGIAGAAGAVLAHLVVRLECEALGGVLIYGGWNVMFSLIANLVGLFGLFRAHKLLSITMFSAWVILLGSGAAIALVTEQERSLEAG